MEVVQVKSKKDIKDFNKVPFKIYKNDPNWIPHLKQDVEKVFDPKKNKYWRHGEAERWLLRDDSGKAIGRVAAWVNKKNKDEQPTGGMGFFECINDEKAAFKLLDTCKQWLAERGMEAMDGPINFGESDKFWGLIIKNFDQPPYYGQNYNPEYYVKFFKDYGFEIFYEQIVFQRPVELKLQDKFEDRSQRILSDPDYEVKPIDRKNAEKFAEEFRHVYNRAWANREKGFSEMSMQQARNIAKAMKPILDEDIIFFAYHKGNPIGFYVSLPELNQIFKYVNGNLNWWGKLKFLWYKKRGVVRSSFGVVFGIDPDYQGKGVEGAIFAALRDHIQPTKKYDDIVITWIGDFNPKMIRIIENLGATEMRRLATFRYLFDRTKEFKRKPIVNVKDRENANG